MTDKLGAESESAVEPVADVAAQAWGALPVSGGRAVTDVLSPDRTARLGHDVRDVQVHVGRESDAVAAGLHARAFTVGRHVYLGRAARSLGPLGHDRVVEHELGHALASREGSRPTAGQVPTLASATEEREARSGQRLTGAGAGITSLETGTFVGLDPIPTETAEATDPVAPDRPDVEELDYAFVFTGGAYGRSAEAFIRRYYPDHRLIRSHSFEAMFDRMFTDMRRVETGVTPHLRELVIVTHANAAGGMQIPLTRGDAARDRFFTVWDVDDLQEEFQQGLHERFRRRRRQVVATMFDADTRVIVRGCEFGQSDEALDVLRSLLGGQAWIWAPRVYQGYESAPIGTSHLGTAEEAFDFLMEQDYLPPELEPAPDEQKREYIARVFGLRGHVPTEFFVVGQEAHDELAAMIDAGTGRSEAAEELKVREPASVPSLGAYWNLSAPSSAGSDAELDQLSLREIALEARRLNRPYRPQNAGMLRRLRAAWERKEFERPEHIPWLLEDNPDPLAGLPGDSLGFMQFLERHYRDRPDENPLAGIEPENYWGDANMLAIHAAQYPSPTPHADLFETEMLEFEPPTEEQRTQAAHFEDELATAPPRGTPAPTTVESPDDESELELYRRAHTFDKGAERPPPLPPEDFTSLSDTELMMRYRQALREVDVLDLARLEGEMVRRMEDPDHPGFGTAMPRDLVPGRPANAGVSPEVALDILRNSTEGRFPWRPDLGRVGRVAWFVTEGDPYVGGDRGGSVTIPVELVHPDQAIVFHESDLLEIFERERAALEPIIEAEYRRTAQLNASTALTSKQRRYIRGRFLERAAESRMWERVGERVRASEHGVGEVVLENSRFSRQGNGRFAVVRDASRIRIRGGVSTVLASLRTVGEPVNPILTAAAEEAATQQRWAGRVRGVFHYGGKVLIVVGLVNDTYRIITAEDRTREVISVAGGWAGATAAGAAFAYWYTPADVAGPWAWVGHGVGTLLAGGIGYFLGSETTTTIYELVIEDDEETESP
ncbi:eCIS core domain-containing protein [Myceligenerans halotolerans]